MREWLASMTHHLATKKQDEQSRAYEASVRRMVIAGASWLESHPDAPQVKWKALSVGQGQQVVFLAPWEDVIRVENPALMDLLGAMDLACQDGKGPTYAPSNLMMQKALECIGFIQLNGWDQFQKEMEK